MVEQTASSSEISPAGLRRFVKHLCIVSKKHHDREVARQELSEHIDIIKELSSSKGPKSKLKNAFEELENKLSLVLEKEKKILQTQQGERLVIRNLKDRLCELEKHKPRPLHKSLNELHGKLDRVIKTKEKRQKRIKDIEKRLGAKSKKKTALSAAEKRVEILEKKYVAMKNNPKYGKPELERVKNLIISLKERIIETKQRV